MDATLVTLQLFLDALGVEPNITTLDDRKRVQKAVYLGQLTGVDLGYRFGWYLMGPYSPTLTRDYYALHTQLTFGDRTDDDSDPARDRRLLPHLASKLSKLRELMKPPLALPLSQEQWLELLASVDYLYRVSRKDEVAVRRILAHQKPQLVEYFDDATCALDAAGQKGLIRPPQ